MTPPPSLGETADRLAKATRLEAVVGRPSTVWSHQRLQRDLPGIAGAVDALQGRLPADATAPGDEPLFIFSAGWRSGSTLLQRLVASSGRYFIWGEPYHQTDVIRRLAESLIPFGTGWPPDEYVHSEPRQDRTGSGSGTGADDEATVGLSSRWIANYYPPVSALLDAHRAFLRELLAPPPPHQDVAWGLKEVRLSAEYGVYLRLLFPRSRFLFLVRDPRDAYLSYRERPTWFERWPRSQIRTPYAYGQVWRRLAESFLVYGDRLGATLIRYEDLVQGGEALDQLEVAIGAPVDRSVLGERVDGAGASGRGGASGLELRMLDRATQSVACRLGYQEERAA